MTPEIIKVIASKAGGQLVGLMDNNAEELANRFNEARDKAESGEITYSIKATIKVTNQANGDHTSSVSLACGNPFSATADPVLVGDPNQDELPLDK